VLLVTGRKGKKTHGGGLNSRNIACIEQNHKQAQPNTSPLTHPEYPKECAAAIFCTALAAFCKNDSTYHVAGIWHCTAALIRVYAHMRPQPPFAIISIIIISHPCTQSTG
jgi:hypothetical protein